MKKITFAIITGLFLNILPASPQAPSDTSVYLITCAPGTETYSVWGHSALRIVIGKDQSDMVYNWGVFDFSTPNFAWKFAKGHLNYMLGVYPYDRFLQDYMLSNRSVWSQEVNFEPVEKFRLMLLLQENMKPENRYYRYDFFYDDCSTRIRDIIEKILANKLIYPPDEPANAPTFREKIGEYLINYPWLRMGVDLLMGVQGERKTSFRDRMFLPNDLQHNLTQAVVNRDRKMTPLLRKAETVLDFPLPEKKSGSLTSPLSIFSLLLIVIIILSALLRNSPVMNFIDIAIFLTFSIIALLMLFLNFFTDHEQMKTNLNIIWLNPILFICLYSLIFGKEGKLWFRIVFVLSLMFLLLIIIFPGAFNSSFLLLVLTLMIRSATRGKFSWNPLSV
jgi:hypothetical protein